MSRYQKGYSNVASSASVVQDLVEIVQSLLIKIESISSKIDKNHEETVELINAVLDFVDGEEPLESDEPEQSLISDGLDLPSRPRP